MIRKISWTIGDDMSITPHRVQNAGVQGDHNATEIEFTIPEDDFGGRTMYIELTDSTGGYDKTDALTPEDHKVSFLMPLAWTQAGGEATVRLVVTDGENGEDTETAYSFAGRIRFDTREVSHTVDSLIKGAIHWLMEKAASVLTSAETAASTATEKAGIATSAAEDALQSEQAALSSANAAAIARSGAVNYATQASSSATAAGESASAASASATAASESEETAEAYATAADSSATAAEESAQAAEEAKEAIVSGGYLKEPSSGIAVGKYFRIASIDDAGHAVLEAVDAPDTVMKLKIAGTAQTPDADGYVNLPYGENDIAGLVSTNVAFGTMSYTHASYKGVLAINRAPDSDIEDLSGSYRPIVPASLALAVKTAMSYPIGEKSPAWTDAEKNGAWTRLSIIKNALDTVLVPNARYYLGTQTAVSITMPTNASAGQEIVVCFASGATACTLTCDLVGFDFVPKANKTSWLKFTCTGADWLVETKEG